MTAPLTINATTNPNTRLENSCNCSTQCCVPFRRRKHIKGCPSDPKVCKVAQNVIEEKQS